MKDNLQRACRRIVNNKVFEITIFILIFASIILISWELAFMPPEERTLVHITNDVIIYIFMVELTLRYFASTDIKSFFINYWIDIIAIIPFLPHFRYLRIIRLLRLLRIASLAVFMRRHLRAFSFLFSKKLIEYAVVFTVVVLVTITATIAYVHFENTGVSSNELKIEDAFWTTLYSLFAGEFADEYPAAIGSRIIILLVTFAGMGLFAFLTGTVSAIMIDRLKEGALLGKLNYQEMENHVIICGWNDHVGKILAEFQSDSDFKGRNYIVISEIEELPDMSMFGVDMSMVHHIKQDFISSETLRYANIQHASTAIILADLNNRSDNDADARTVLAALTIEKLNPEIYSCAELIHPENESHLRMSRVESVVLSSNIAAYMMTQASMKASVVPFYTELLRPSQGNQIFEVEFPKKMLGVSFDDLLPQIKKNYCSILVGVQNKEGKVLINPESYNIQEGDKAIVIGCTKPKLQ